jgi:membrane protease YdiL (CAAX protease family)
MIKLKKLFSNLFRWKPSKETFIAFAVGGIIILLSLLLKFVPNIWGSIFIQNILMVLGSIAFSLYYIQRKKQFEKFGIHNKKWLLFLAINLFLGIVLFFMFMQESPLPSGFSFSSAMSWKIIYLMLVGIFEVIVFYSFIRTILEKSFGIIPAIILTALFYSFHHAGFQPEFVKLFFVGILYATVFRIGNSALLIYPFFWGVGGCYDVLVQSEVVSEILYPEIRAIILLVGIIIIFVGIKFLNFHNNKTT